MTAGVLRRIGAILPVAPGMLYDLFFSVSCLCGERRITLLWF